MYGEFYFLLDGGGGGWTQRNVESRRFGFRRLTKCICVIYILEGLVWVLLYALLLVCSYKGKLI